MTINDMLPSIQGLVTDIEAASDEVTAKCDEMAAAIADLARRAGVEIEKQINSEYWLAILRHGNWGLMLGRMCRSGPYTDDDEMSWRWVSSRFGDHISRDEKLLVLNNIEALINDWQEKLQGKLDVLSAVLPKK